MSSPFILFFLIIEDKIEAVNQTGEMEHSTLVPSGLFDEGKSFWQEEQQGRIIAPLIFIFPLLAEGHRLFSLYCAIASSSAQLVGTCQQLFARREGYFCSQFTAAFFPLYKTKCSRRQIVCKIGALARGVVS